MKWHEIRLFEKYIFYDISGAYTDAKTSLANSQTLVNKLCPNTQTLSSCLQNLPSSILLSQSTGVSLIPNSAFINPNKATNVDILIGFNQDEATFFFQSQSQCSTCQTYIDQTTHNLLTSVNNVPIVFNNDFVYQQLSAYSSYSTSRLTCLTNYFTNDSIYVNDYYNGTLDFNLNTPANLKANSAQLAWQKLSKIVSDYKTACPAINFNTVFTKNTGKTYMYKFNYRSTTFNPRPVWEGVTHTDEVPYVYGYYLGSNPNDLKMSSKMMSYWSNFAKTGQLYIFILKLNLCYFTVTSYYYLAWSFISNSRSWFNFHLRPTLRPILLIYSIVLMLQIPVY